MSFDVKFAMQRNKNSPWSLQNTSLIIVATLLSNEDTVGTVWILEMTVYDFSQHTMSGT